MNVVISNQSGVPIYEQIKEQIKASILSGELSEGTPFLHFVSLLVIYR